MNFNQAIQDLLFEHECVIIPSFGGFVTSYKPAFIHPKKQMVFPPSKKLSFNVNLKNNDGLLVNYISQKENISYQTAAEFVTSSVEEFKNELNTDKRLSLEGIGWISVNTSGALEFSPEDTRNFLRNSFGLKPVFLPTIEELLADKVTTPLVAPIIETEVISIAPAKEEETPSIRRKTGWVAAAAFLGVMFIGGMQVQENSSNIASFFSSFIPGKTAVKEAKFLPRLEDEKLHFTYEEEVSELALIVNQNPELQSVFYSFEKGEISPDGLKVVLKKSSADVSSTEYKRNSSSLELYFVVAGCFQDETNADGLVKKLRRKGFDAGIFGKKGRLHLVCYGSYTNRSAAKSALQGIKSSENPGAWLKKH